MFLLAPCVPRMMICNSPLSSRGTLCLLARSGASLRRKPCVFLAFLLSRTRTRHTTHPPDLMKKTRHAHLRARMDFTAKHLFLLRARDVGWCWISAISRLALSPHALPLHRTYIHPACNGIGSTFTRLWRARGDFDSNAAKI